jgi:small subunit ribosomal protein S16
MLAIRMQRTGHSGHAQFRVVVQDSRRTPTSGKLVAQLGSYDPHAKTTSLDKEKASFYLEHGAQPSGRTARLLKAEGIALPKWVEVREGKQSKLRNPQKLRRNQPKETPAPAAPEAVTEPEPATEVEQA